MKIHSQERQIADHVQDLVSNTFIGVSESVADDSFTTEDQDVGLGDTTAEAGGAERLGLGFQQEGATGRQFALEARGRQVDQIALAPYDRVWTVIKVVREGELLLGTRMGGEEGVTFSNAQRTLEHESLAWPSLLDNTDSADCVHERSAR